MFEKIFKNIKSEDQKDTDGKKQNKKIENIIFLIILLIITVIIINNVWGGSSKKSKESTDKVLAKTLDIKNDTSSEQTSRIL